MRATIPRIGIVTSTAIKRPNRPVGSEGDTSPYQPITGNQTGGDPAGGNLAALGGATLIGADCTGDHRRQEGTGQIAIAILLFPF